VAAARDRGLRPAVGKGIFYGAPRSEAPNTHGLDVHIVGAGQLGRPGGDVLLDHARSVTILCRGDSLEKSMSRYLIDQIATRPNIASLPHRGRGAHGETSLEAIDVATPTRARRRALESAGSSSSSAPTPRPAGCRRDRARPRGYVLTGSDVRRAGVALDRDPYLLETSVPGIFACGDVRFSPVKRVAAAVGEGSMAIAFVHQYLKDADPPRAR
jgi:thioredoxin reductase (NADPH)